MALILPPGKALIRQLESDGIDWLSVAEIWAKEKGCRPEDVAPGILAAANLGRCDMREVEPGVCKDGLEVWRCKEPVQLPGWACSRFVNFVLTIQEPAADAEGGAMGIAMGGGMGSGQMPMEEGLEGDSVVDEDEDEGGEEGRDLIFERGYGAHAGSPSGVQSPIISRQSPGIGRTESVSSTSMLAYENESPLGSMYTRCVGRLSRGPSAGLATQMRSPALSPHHPAGGMEHFSQTDTYLFGVAGVSGVKHERVAFSLASGGGGVWSGGAVGNSRGGGGGTAVLQGTHAFPWQSRPQTAGEHSLGDLAQDIWKESALWAEQLPGGPSSF